MATSDSTHITPRSARRKMHKAAARAELRLAGRKDHLSRRYRLRVAVAAVRAVMQRMIWQLKKEARTPKDSPMWRALKKLRRPLG